LSNWVKTIDFLIDNEYVTGINLKIDGDLWVFWVKKN
jgi:hypothetical protein